MKNLQMVDLKSQHEKIKDEIEQTMADVIQSAYFINGKEVKEFQKDLEKYLNVKHVIPCANGTDALQIAIMGLDLKAGDEVITTDFTFVSIVEVATLLQLTPILVDVEINSMNISTEAIKKAITKKTKAIIPVHLFGRAANMDVIMKIAEEYNLYVIEDNAQAMGGVYNSKKGNKKLGTIGHIGTTSFFPSKNLGCYGDGGAIFTNNDNLAYKIRGIVNHGMYKKYHYDTIGVNSRLDSLQAAVLKIKLKYLDEYNKIRQKAALYYSNAFKKCNKIITPHTYQNCDYHVFHQYILRIVDGKRYDLMEHLKNKEIPCEIYYPIPLHRQKAYVNYRYKEKKFPMTNQLVNEVIALPMHTELDIQQQDFIIHTILDFLE